MELTYTKHGDYYLPNIVALEDKEISVNRYGRMHDEYLKKHRNILYNELLLTGQLRRYLSEIGEQAETRISMITGKLAEKENVTEQLKADNQLEWIRRMNGIRNRAEEVVLSELIFC